MMFLTAGLETLFVLIAGHALCDFALQNEWIATNKNRNLRDAFTEEQKKTRETIWPWLMSAHSLHHGLAVYLITQRIELGIAETVAHFITDFGKCEGWYGFHMDQIIHVLCKVVWVAWLVS